MTRETTRCESILKVDDDVLFDPDRLQLLLELGLADQQHGEETNLVGAEAGLVGQHTGESEGAVHLKYRRMADLQNLLSQKKNTGILAKEKFQFHLTSFKLAFLKSS